MNNGYESRGLHQPSSEESNGGTGSGNGSSGDVEVGNATQAGDGQTIDETQGEENIKAEVQAQALGEIAAQLEEDMEEYIAQARVLGQLSLNFYKYKRCWPESVRKFTNYAQSKAKGNTFEEADIAGIFLFAPRLLYEFLDSVNINLNIYKAAGDWCFSIVEDEPVFPFNNRIETEIAGFEEAFACYEEILTT